MKRFLQSSARRYQISKTQVQANELLFSQKSVSFQLLRNCRNLFDKTYSAMSTVSVEVWCFVFPDFVDLDDDEHQSNGLDAFGAKQASRVEVRPMPSTAPMERLKLQLFSTMSGLYLNSELGWLMITAIAI